MKKVLISLLAVMLLTVGLASATAFEVIKNVEVTGDYKWDGGWTLPDPEPVTATYSFHGVSPSATSANYAEAEVMGLPWQYSLDMNVGANSAGTAYSGFSAWTVNDPATTPATGGYTQYGFHSASQSDYTSSSLTVTGEGAVGVMVSTMFDAGFEQINQVRVN